MLCLPENIYCGYCDCSEFGTLTISPPRRVTKYEIEFYLEDGKTTTSDDRTYHIKKHHVQIAKPGQVRHSVLPFQTAFLKFSVDGEIASRLDSATEYFCSSHPNQMYDMLKEIILLNESGDTMRLQGKILLFLDLVLSDSRIPASRNGENYGIISDAKGFIKANFAEPIRLEDISAAVHLSPIYFHNIFTEATGISPHKYLINVRIDNAKKLLWDTEIPLSVIGDQSGFGCQQYFSKVFKKETGLSPAAYRRSCQGNYMI